MSANLPMRSAAGGEVGERTARLVAVLVLGMAAATIVAWHGPVRALPAVETWVDVATGGGPGGLGGGGSALGGGVVLASSTVPDVVREHSAAIGALLVLALGVLVLLRIVAHLAGGF